MSARRRLWLLAPLSLLMLGVGPIDPILPPQPPSDFPAVGGELFGDSGAGDAAAVWGSVDCERRRRVRTTAASGDPAPRADGAAQDAAGFRRLRVRDGDTAYGERCELGRNDHRFGPTAAYREGERRITFLSLRLGARFPIHSRRWQVVMQMKQTQPSDAGGGTPVLALHAFDGRWRLWHTDPDGDNSEIWSVPAERRAWTRFAFDGLYSINPRVGSLRVYVDRNGDGDAADEGERSRRFEIATLKREEEGTDGDGIPAGTAIPSHLRAGIYHPSDYRCRRTRCSIGVDNVGVYAAPGG